MSIQVIRPDGKDMGACVARFADLVRCNTGLPDMQLPECKRTFLNVLGFSQPKGDGQYSPFGDRAPAAISHIRAGFGLAFVAAEPGRGVLMHTHDTVETFMVMEGRWKLEWEVEGGVESVVLAPLDFIACPIGVQRRFECVEAPAGKTEGLLLGIIGGDAPAAEISPEGEQRLREAGIYPPEPAHA